MSSHSPDNRPRKRTRSTYSRIMRLVVPMILGTFLVIGLALFFGIRANAQDTLTQTHRADIDEFANDVNGEFQRFIDDLRAVASQREALDFARDTLINISGATIEDTQNRLLGDFASVLQQNPDYLALRYVTFNGSIWSEVTNYDATIPRADSRIKLGALASDPSLAQALTAAPGEVVVSDITFQLNPNAPILDRLIPFIRLSVPITPESSFDTNIAGVIQLDVQPGPLLKFMASAANSGAARQSGRRILVANHAGLILYDTANPEFDVLRSLALRQSPLLSTQYPDAAEVFQPEAADAQSKNGNIFSTNRIVFGDPDAAFWTVTLVDDAAQLAGSSSLLSVGALAGSLALGGLICALIGVVLTRTLLPIGSMKRLVNQFGQVGVSPDATATPLISQLSSINTLSTFESDDEIGELMGTFRAVGERIDALKAEMESQQGRYNRSIDITARVSRETATLHDIDAVLNRAINLICDEFGFYHAQVFLVDDVGDNAVLVYSHGEIGQQLLAAHHKIAIGSESVIGRAAGTGKAVVVNDTTHTSDAPHKFNPLLPGTRSEVALPLQFGDNILGALDVQSVQPDSFQADEVRTFQILADQIAIAMQNVRLLAQSEQRIMQIDALNRQLTQMAWAETSQRSGLEQIYRYDLLNLTHDEPSDPLADVPTFSLPILIRGEVIGTLNAAPPEGMTFTEGDYTIMRAVTDRVAIAIENARLFEEAQMQAQRALALAEAGQLASR
ncbi:MAG: GAF domain-containing protein, partial [Chloroflexota bacterium]